VAWVLFVAAGFAAKATTGGAIDMCGSP